MDPNNNNNANDTKSEKNDETDYYAILGCDKDANAGQLKKRTTKKQSSAIRIKIQETKKPKDNSRFSMKLIRFSLTRKSEKFMINTV